MFNDALLKQAADFIAICRSKGVMIATAESCTGGMLSALLTEIPGSSAVFERGFITYSNASKTELLGVPQSLIAEYGAVSEQVVTVMAEGARRKASVNLAVAITGIAGPEGGSPKKPVGTVHIAVASDKIVNASVHRFTGNRNAIRQAATARALAMLHEAIRSGLISFA